MAILLFIVALLIVSAIALFYSLQRYIVYEQDGLRLVVPFLTSADITEPHNTHGAGNLLSAPSQDVIIATPDYSGVEAVSTREMPPLQALFVPAGDVNEAKFSEHLARLETTELQAMVIEVKPEIGPIPYLSNVGLTNSFGTNGSFDLASQAVTLKSQGIYLVALLSVCADELMALRNPPIALRGISGAAYEQDGTYWLDPYNKAASDYILEFMTELAVMGFDEILLGNLSHPEIAPTEIMYSQTISSERDSVTAISNLAIRLTDSLRGLDLSGLRQEVHVPPTAGFQDNTPGGADGEAIPPDDTADGESDASPPSGGSNGTAEEESSPEEGEKAEIRISVLMDASRFREGAESSLTGVDPELFFKIFERVFIYTSAEYYSGDIEIAEGIFSSEAASRFVPFVYNRQDSGSFVLR